MPDTANCNFNGMENHPINQTIHTDNVIRFAGGPGSIKETLFDRAPYDTALYVNTYFSKTAAFELLGQTPTALRNAAIMGIGFHFGLDAAGGKLILLASAGECNGLRLSDPALIDRNLISLPSGSASTSNPEATHLQWVDFDTFFKNDKFAVVKATTALIVKFRRSQLYGLFTAGAYTATDGWVTAKAVIAFRAAENRYFLSVEIEQANPTPNTFAYSTDPCPPICY